MDERLKSLIEDNVMKVISIEYPTSLNNCNIKNDNIDIFVKVENGNKYCITVATIEMRLTELHGGNSQMRLIRQH